MRNFLFVLYVSHDNDGYWQFLCGWMHKEEDARVVSLASILDLEERNKFDFGGKLYMVSKNIAHKYFDGLKKAYMDNNVKKEWDDFENVIHGASESDIAKLREIYPETPDALIKLLKIVDGTYWREYQGEEIAFYMLGSDVTEYPYYLLSVNQIIETQNEAYDFYADYVNREFDPEDVLIDDKIINDAEKMRWLHFSDCMNNGGTSQLFIDFSPSDNGVKGQIVRFLHDPDEIEVIADSFEEYLQQLIDNGYDFINEDTVGE